MRTVETCTGINVAAIEGIAFKKGWISIEELRNSADKYGKSPYGQYLQRVADGLLLG